MCFPSWRFLRVVSRTPAAAPPGGAVPAAGALSISLQRRALIVATVVLGFVLLRVAPLHRPGGPHESGASAVHVGGAALARSNVSPVGAERLNSLRVRFHSLGVPAKGDQDELLSELRKVLATSKPEEFARSLTPEEMATPLGNAALEAWLASDSLAACVWIAGRPDAGDSEAWLVAHVLAQQPATLAEFCRQLGATPWAETFLDYTSREMLHRSPVAAVSFAESLPRGERRARLFDAIAFDWMDRDATAASAWIGALHDPELRQRLAAVAAEAYATTKPAVAVEWLLNQAPRDGVPLEPLQTIVGIWQQTAPREAEAWLKLLRNAELANELAAKR